MYRVYLESPDHSIQVERAAVYVLSPAPQLLERMDLENSRGVAWNSLTIHVHRTAGGGGGGGGGGIIME